MAERRPPSVEQTGAFWASELARHRFDGAAQDERLLRLAVRAVGAAAAAFVESEEGETRVVAHLGTLAGAEHIVHEACARALSEQQAVHLEIESARAPRHVLALPVPGRSTHALCVVGEPAQPAHDAINTLHDIAALAAIPAHHDALLRELDRFEALVKTSAHLVLISKQEGHMTELTDRWESLIGSYREMLQNGSWRERVHPADRPAIAVARARIVATGEMESMVLRMQVQDGSYRWFQGRAVPIYEADGQLREIVGTFTDIHERYTARQKVRQSEERLRLALEASRIGMWHRDGATGEVSMTDEALELLGTTREAFDVEKWERLEYVHPDDREALRSRARQMGRSGWFELTMEHRMAPDADGNVRWVRSVSRVSRGEDDTGASLIGTIVDITPEKEREAALARARDEAEEMLHLRNTFLANLSHEIRTPLTAVLGFSDVLRAEAPPSIHHYVDFIESSAQRLNDTLTTLLELSALHAGTRELVFDEVDLVSAVSEVIGRFERPARERGLDLSLALPSPVPTVRSDARALRVILENLVSNAVKFTREGRVVVTVESRGDEARVCVRDTGKGITAAFLPHVFDEFKQESTGMARSHEGAGLGLSVSRELAARIGASLHVESTVGEGSVFTLLLPA